MLILSALLTTIVMVGCTLAALHLFPDSRNAFVFPFIGFAVVLPLAALLRRLQALPAYPFSRGIYILASVLWAVVFFLVGLFLIAFFSLPPVGFIFIALYIQGYSATAVVTPIILGLCTGFALGKILARPQLPPRKERMEKYPLLGWIILLLLAAIITLAFLHHFIMALLLFFWVIPLLAYQPATVKTFAGIYLLASIVLSIGLWQKQAAGTDFIIPAVGVCLSIAAFLLPDILKERP